MYYIVLQILFQISPNQPLSFKLQLQVTAHPYKLTLFDGYIMCGVTGTLVRKESLTRLLNVLDPVLPNWSLFAQQIGVPYSKVIQIETTNARIGPNWLYTCLQQALDWWIDNCRNPCPTYEVIIGVLDPAGDEMTSVMNRQLGGEVRQFMAREQGKTESLGLIWY